MKEDRDAVKEDRNTFTIKMDSKDFGVTRLYLFKCFWNQTVRRSIGQHGLRFKGAWRKDTFNVFRCEHRFPECWQDCNAKMLKEN